MQTSVTKNNAWDFRNHEWNILIDSNGLLIMWFLEWNQKAKDNPLQILEFFARKYQQSAGCEPWPMGGKVSLDGKYVSRDDDDLEPYFMVNTPDGVGYIYPYAFVALPKKGGGHTVVRMD